tara:strand:+ start:80 stop:217 length:138 start_codon:yes stop_codon:yes gene_type:complete
MVKEILNKIAGYSVLFITFAIAPILLLGFGACAIIFILELIGKMQ